MAGKPNMSRRRPEDPPKKLPIDLVVVDTTDGGWLIAIETIVATEGAENLLLGIILEQSINDQRFRMRKLGIIVSVRSAHDPDRIPILLGRIRDWIETTQGDGFLDLTQSTS
jgi:hypothetical protein